METNLDQKQLLILGYLRRLLAIANIPHYQLDDNYNEKKTENDLLDSPGLAPLSKYEQQMQLFNLGIPSMKTRSFSIDSVASDLSDHDTDQSKYGTFIIPINVIQFVYLYFNRYQNFLLLLGGSEECKNNSYNQVQIINLRNISDIQQNMQYPYTNYKLNPKLWRDRINYKKYYTKSVAKYLVQSKSATTCTAQPLSTISEKRKPQTPQPISIGVFGKESKTNESQTTIQVDSPCSPWSSMNSPYSPYSPLNGKKQTNNNNVNARASNLAMPSVGGLRQRSKSSSNLTKLGQKDAMKMSIQTSKNKNKRKNKKTVSMKSRKSATNISDISIPPKPKRQKSKTLTPKKPSVMRRHSANSLIGKKRKKGNRGNGKNAVTDNMYFDRYSYGECVMSVSSHLIGILPSWPWLKAKYNSDIRRKADTLDFAKYKMFIRCGGIFTKDDEYSNDNDLIFFNAANLNDIGRQIDCYYCKLPSLRQKIESPAIVYNNINNLLSFGGYSYDDGKALKSIHSLNLNTKRSKFKWKKYGCLMMKARYDSSVTHIVNNVGQNKFIIIGGKGSSTKPIDCCEMFDSSKTSKQSKCMLLNELNFARFKPGSCQINGDKSKIAVCGGILYGKGANVVEMYDLNKDKWTMHATPLQYDHIHPSIWSEVRAINPNILYVAGNNISFGAKKGSLGYIEWTDLRMKAKKFNLLYDEPIEQLFEFWNLRPNIWEPRSLIQFPL